MLNTSFRVDINNDVRDLFPTIISRDTSREDMHSIEIITNLAEIILNREFYDEPKIVTQDKFDKLNIINNDSICAICLETNLKGEVVELPCKHYFHKNCAKGWLLEKSTLCPMCKKSVE